jgi:hypothetical protein
MWLLSAVWLAVAVPAFAVQSAASAITYVDADGDRRIFAFVRGDSGHLVLNHFNGTSWTWIDHGLPAGATSISGPQAITYVDSAGNRRIYVFAKNSSNKLVLRYFNGFQWQWVDQGGPALLGLTLSVITYIDPSGNRRIYAFAVEDDQYHLVVNYWNGATWQWGDNGLPAGGKITTTDAITYIDDNGQRRIDVFCRGGVSTSFPLYVNSWNGSSWQWTNHGGSNIGSVSAVSYVDTSGARQIWAFAKREGGLFANVWNGFSWLWTHLGVPAGEGDSILYNISAIAYTDNANTRHLSAFMEFSGALFVKAWNGVTWSWSNLGLPAGKTSIQAPTTLSYINTRGGTQRIHVFAIGSDGHLVMNYWNGSTWQWSDQGTM